MCTAVCAAGRILILCTCSCVRGHVHLCSIEFIAHVYTLSVQYGRELHPCITSNTESCEECCNVSILYIYMHCLTLDAMSFTTHARVS